MLRPYWRSALVGFLLVFVVLSLLPHSEFHSEGTETPENPWTPALEFREFRTQLELKNPPCKPIEYGTGWGKHHLCQRIYRQPCVFYSFGVADDYTFDADLAKRSGCLGFAFDPSVSHKTQLVTGVLFMQAAARQLEHSDSAIVTTIPALRAWLRHEAIAVLKMDAEGSEFALAEDIINEEPEFFRRVDQFAVEVHLPMAFMATATHMENWALLLRLLRLGGLRLAHAAMTSCHPNHEKTGCLPELLEAGYSCVEKQMCQNFLFAR